MTMGGGPAGRGDDGDENRAPGARSRSNTGKMSIKEQPDTVSAPSVPIAPSNFFGTTGSTMSYADKLAQRSPLAPLNLDGSGNSSRSGSRMDIDLDKDVRGAQVYAPSTAFTSASLPAKSETMHVERTSSYAGGLNLDDDDTIPPSPSSEVALEEPPRYEQISYTGQLDGSSGYPDINTLQIGGHGQLINALLGHSKDPDFTLEKSISAWSSAATTPSPASIGHGATSSAPELQELWDITLAKDFVAAPLPAPKGSSTSPGPPPRSSYSQALRSSPSTSAAQTDASSSSKPQGSPTPGAHPAAASSPAPTSASMDTSGSGFSYKLTSDQLEAARPHPHALYNTKTHSWSIVTPVPPPSEAKSLDDTALRTANCHHSPTDEDFRKTHAHVMPAHHYVRMPHQVDPKYILRQPDVQNPSSPLSQLGGPSSAPFPDPLNRDDASYYSPSTPRSQWWDLYVCSRCRNAFTLNLHQASIPSVFTRKVADDFVRARTATAKDQKPLTQLDKDQIVKDAIEYVWKVIRNVLYNEARSLIPVSGVTFVKRMGSSNAAKELFARAGFTLKAHPHEANKEVFHPPPFTPLHYLILTRAFLEISIWSARLNAVVAGQTARSGEGAGIAPHDTGAQTASHLVALHPFETVLTKVAGRDTVPQYQPTITRGAWQSSSSAASSYQNRSYKILGVTPETPDYYIKYAYQMQLSTDPIRLPFYLEGLKEVSVLRSDGSSSASDLEMKVAMESSGGRAAWSEIVEALKILGWDRPQPTAAQCILEGATPDVPTEDEAVKLFTAKKEEIEDSFLGQTSPEKLKEAGKAMKRVKSALELLDKASYNSEFIKALLSSIADDDTKPAIPVFSEEEAYKILQLNKDQDDAMIVVAVQLYLTEGTTDYQKNKIKGALLAVAAARNSDALREYAETGKVPDSGNDMQGINMSEQEPPASLDRPAGLQNIGNTCYLNSLLQYFFTIKELRDVVLEYQKYQEDEPTEEVLAKKRVGGRQVTKKEIQRSKKFVAHLSTLFQQLIHSQTASVRPEVDLAYLALVSNKDEEEAASPKVESSNGQLPSISEIISTEPQADVPNPTAEGLAAAQPVEAGSPTVLGKRNSDHLVQDMEIDAITSRPPPSGEDPSTADGAREPPLADTTRKQDENTEGTQSEAFSATQPMPSEKSEELVAKPAADGVIEILPSNEDRGGMAVDKPGPPPLPPRPTAKKSSSITNTNMMFGKQNDVSEAMDNVIFQIEVGLDDSKIRKASATPSLSPSSPSAGRSFVQSLFYGTTQQILSFEPASATAAPEVRVKEETFSYLLVDVANEGNTLYDGLDASFQPSIVDIEGKKAKRVDVLKELPPVLQIQLQRVQFDRKTSRVYKSNAYMPFPLTLKMSRYMAYDEQDEQATGKHRQTQELRERIVRAKKRLADLEQKNEDKQTIPEILKEAEAALRQASDPIAEDAQSLEFAQKLSNEFTSDGDDVLGTLASTAQSLADEVGLVKQELESCRAMTDRIWEDDHEAEYELSSVFIHLGAAGYGHYYLYQRALPSQPDRWMKMNDSTVTDVDVSEVFADTTGSTANPYWLSYVRKSEIPERIDAVCRRF